MYVCVYLKGGVTTERTEEIFSLLAYSPNACNSQAWARFNSRARRNSHMNGRDTSTWTNIGNLPTCINTRLDQNQRSKDSYWHSTMEMDFPGVG